MDAAASTDSGGARPVRLTAVRRRRSPISLTPLIDVVFILLVFFMLASSFLEWRTIDLDAPAVASGAGRLEGAMLVEIRQADLRLSGEAMGLEQLATRLSHRLAERPDQRVFLKPAAGVPLQRAVDVLDRLGAAGVVRVSLIRDGVR